MQTIEAPELKHWTAAEYHRMSELGILKADERTELIAGQILFMAAKGTPHVTTLRLLAVALDRLLGVPFNDQSFSSALKTRFNWMIFRSQNLI